MSDDFLIIWSLYGSAIIPCGFYIYHPIFEDDFFLFSSGCFRKFCRFLVFLFNLDFLKFSNHHILILALVFVKSSHLVWQTVHRGRSCSVTMFLFNLYDLMCAKYFYNHHVLFINCLKLKRNKVFIWYIQRNNLSYVRYQFSFKIKVEDSFNYSLTFSFCSVHVKVHEKLFYSISICLLVIFLKGGLFRATDGT